MIIWYLLELGLTLGRHASCELLAFDVNHSYTPLMGSSVGLRMIQETILGFHTKKSLIIGFWT